MKAKKYHFVYETTNLINSKVYRGTHSTNNLNDGYIGSGKVFTRAVKKYGRANFNRTILEFASSQKDSYKLEEKYVDKSFVSRSDTYNMVIGGRYPDYVKQRKALSSIKHQEGSKNSQFNTMWINDGKTARRIPKSNLIPTGWKKGRRLTPVKPCRIPKGSKIDYITNGTVDKQIIKGSEIPAGWKLGRVNCHRRKSAKIKSKSRFPHGTTFNWITNGYRNRRILKNEIPPEGWEFGRTQVDKNGTNHHNKGKRWVNDGKNKKLLLKTEKLPDGWEEGMGSR